MAELAAVALQVERGRTGRQDQAAAVQEDLLPIIHNRAAVQRKAAGRLP
jgi:hypothetical protein